jgi:Ca2+-binding RTX toxin-like protein
VLSVVGSRASNIVVGGAGKDVLSGGTGQDVLIGGGADVLNAGSGGDVLIGGRTAYDANLSALEAVLAEWSSGGLYQDRVRDLFGNSAGGLNGTTVLSGSMVINDGAVNVVNGGLGMDWFWLEAASDKFSGEERGEIVTVK